MPALESCADDSRGVVTCIRDMADRRFDLPGEVAPPLPTTFPRPDPRPISAEAPQPAPAPESPADEAITAQGGPYIPPTPERIADLDPQPIEPRPQPIGPHVTPPPPNHSILPDAPAQTLPLAGRDGDGGEPDPVAQSEPPTAAIAPEPVPEPEQPLVVSATPRPSPPAVVSPSPTNMQLSLQTEFAPDTPALALGEGGEPHPVALSEPQPIAVVEPEPLILATAPEPSKPAPAPIAPPPTIALPAVAAGPEWLPDPTQPSIAAPLALSPTIDAIELDGARNFVSGTGPAGALMRLFADDEMVGEGTVEDGHWLVETAPLLTAPRLELRIEAIDPDSGRSLGESAITLEIQLPPDAEPFPVPSAPTELSEPPSNTPAPAEPSAEPARPEPEPKPRAALTAQTDPPASVVVAKPAPEPQAPPQPAPIAPQGPSVSQPVAATEPATDPAPVPPVPQSRETPRKLPGLLPVTPQRSSPSVMILGPASGSPSTAILD